MSYSKWCYLWQPLLLLCESAVHQAGPSAGMHSLYMTGPPAGAQSSLAQGQSGLADAAFASCPGGDHSFHAYSRRHTLEQHTHTHTGHSLNTSDSLMISFSNNLLMVEGSRKSFISLPWPLILTCWHHRVEAGGAFLWNLNGGQLCCALKNLWLSLVDTYSLQRRFWFCYYRKGGT